MTQEQVAEFLGIGRSAYSNYEDGRREPPMDVLEKFANIMGTSQSQFSNIGSTIAMLGNNFATTEAPIAVSW